MDAPGGEVIPQRIFPAGTLVKHQGSGGENPEYGFVVQSESDGGLSYYVACFGASVLSGHPTTAPYMHRFPAMSLERVEGDPRRPLWDRQAKLGLEHKLARSRILWGFLAILKTGFTVWLIVALVQHWSCH